MKTTVFSFTLKGRLLSETLKKLFDGADCFGKYDDVSLSKRVERAFCDSGCIVFIGASGIAVRAIAPYIKSKEKDPAVIVIDENGRFVIPLLSGHLGGANEYADMIAHCIGGQAIITTATDINHVFSVDVWAKRSGLHIENIENIKHISSALLRGEKIGLLCEYPLDGKLPDFIDQDNKKTGIYVYNGSGSEPFTRSLKLIPKTYCLGIGCRKDIDSGYFEDKLLKILEEHGIPLNLVRGMASIDLKADEKAIIDFCGKYRVDFNTYSAEVLSGLKGDFSSSDFVEKTTGIGNVCERSAVMLSGNGRLILKKTVVKGITVAVAMKEWRCFFGNGNDRG